MTTSTEQERTGRYTKKPVTIEAVQYGRRFDWPDWFHDAVSVNKIVVHGTGKHADPRAECFATIYTLEGAMTASEGDWIIRGVKGELYPCKPDVFAATYEPEQAARRAQVVQVPQWGKVGTCEWFDGYADHSDGGGPYKERFLYAAAPQPPEHPKCTECNDTGIGVDHGYDCTSCYGALPSVKTVSCACGDEYAARSYGAGFIDACGRCPNCEPCESFEVLLPEPDINTANHAGVRVVGYTAQQVRQILSTLQK